MSDFEKVTIPDGRYGLAKIDTYTPSKFDLLRAALARMPGDERPVKRLLVNGSLVMSDSPFEMDTNRELIWNARGDVLIAGLGLGMILPPLLATSRVHTVTVIEKSHDVIELVARHYIHPKLKVIHADIFEWKPPYGSKWDTIYFDIWPNICTDNLKEMKMLHKKFQSRKRKGGWMASWSRDILRDMR